MTDYDQLSWNNANMIIILPIPVIENDEVVDWKLPDVFDCLSTNIVLSEVVRIESLRGIITGESILYPSMDQKNRAMQLFDIYFGSEIASIIPIMLIIRIDIRYWISESISLLEEGFVIFQLEKMNHPVYSSLENSRLAERAIELVMTRQNFKNIFDERLRQSIIR